MAKYVDGYYLIQDLVLFKLKEIPQLVGSPQHYTIITVAVSNRIDTKVRKTLLDGRIISVTEKAVDEWNVQKIQEDQLDTIQLLFDTGDQSAAGTTVEAKSANSIVSDAKSSGGQNDDL